MDGQDGGRTGSQSIERAMSVLDCFVGRTALTLTQVADRTGLPVSTTHRIMQALLRGGFLDREAEDAYRIGRHVAELVPRQRLLDEVAPHLYALAAGIKITVCFGVPEDAAVSTLLRARPPVRTCAAQVPADREPLHASAMGKTFLAFDPACLASFLDRSDPLTNYTSRTRTSEGDLLEDVRRTRRLGYALSDEERTDGVRAVAVPVFGQGRRLVGAIGVQARSVRMNDDLVMSLVPLMRRFAAETTRRLGDHQLV
jgi:DNA-binding IclR family transcriptional regulator